MHPAALADEELLRACEVTKGRTSGPGGQRRNKVETRITLTHTPTGVVAHAGERRSARENLRVAVFRLRLALATEVRSALPADRFGDSRSELWKSRTTAEGRVVCNPKHPDFPALLAEAMNVIEAVRGDPGRAGLRLVCTPSQLVRFVQHHPAAMEKWNSWRAERGVHPLR